MPHGMRGPAAAYDIVTEVTAEIVARETVRRGARAVLYSAIGALKAAGAPHDHVAVAERLVLAVHWVEFASVHSAPVDLAAARTEMDLLYRAWARLPRLAVAEGRPAPVRDAPSTPAFRPAKAPIILAA